MNPTGELKGYAILNTDLNRFLTSATGKGIWEEQHRVQEVLEVEFGGKEHLEVVEVRNTEKADVLGKLQTRISDWLKAVYEEPDAPSEEPAVILFEEKSGMFVARLEKSEVEELESMFYEDEDKPINIGR